MTQSEKLQELIQKAIDNGWDVFNDPDDGFFIGEDKLHDWKGYETADNLFVICNHHRTCANDFIFNHDFAKSLLPDISSPDRTILLDSQTGFILNIEDRFKSYLSSAVVSDNPIDYLYKAVFNENS